MWWRMCRRTGCLREGARSYAKRVPAPRRGLPGRARTPARAMRASDPTFRVDQRVGAEPLDRRRGRQDGSRTPAGSRRTCGPCPLRPWRFFAEPIRHRRASRSASRCGRANRADLCRLRPRLEERRLPVAGPAARRPAGGGRQRRGQPLPRLRLRPPRRPAGSRQLPAGPAEGRRAHGLEARPPRPQSGSSGRWCPICAPWPASTRRPTPRADRSCTVFDPRPAGSCSASSRHWPSSSGS